MCGIYGIFDPTAPLSEAHKAWADDAERRLQHRGPDGQQRLMLLGERCLLGHLRLAIIDLEGGAQPIGNEDGTVWVVCNGEIYNFLELREKLEKQGHRFSTHSDTEVLVHLFEEKGTALLEDLEGMFAFAIVDTRSQQVFLARDRFGEKPLYWAPIAKGKGIAFASEMKALTSLGGMDLDLDLPALAQYLALNYVPAPRTHLKGVRKLRAGEALVLHAGKEISCTRYWRPQFALETGNGPVRWEETVAELRDCFREALRLRLRSDVPVGAFLSGGIDSTLVVSVVRELLPGSQFQTFCAVFDDDQLNEAPYARAIAERAGSDHYEVRISSSELLENFNALIDHYDEPFADPSMFPTFAVCKAARQHCTVMLSGDGGDECFGGYRRFFAYRSWDILRRFPATQLAASALSRYRRPNSHGQGLLTFLGKNDWDLLYSREVEADCIANFQLAYQEAAREGLEELRAAAREHVHLNFPASAMEFMANSYLPEQILVKVDRASMRSAVECRTPFLDRRLFQFAASLPMSYHFAEGQGKALLRRCLPTWVPDELRKRAKQGFTPPLAEWLRGSLHRQMEEGIADLADRLGDVFVIARAAELAQRHQQGVDHSQSLFRWIVLGRRTGGACS